MRDFWGAHLWFRVVVWTLLALVAIAVYPLTFALFFGYCLVSGFWNEAVKGQWVPFGMATGPAPMVLVGAAPRIEGETLGMQRERETRYARERETFRAQREAEEARTCAYEDTAEYPSEAPTEELWPERPARERDS
jgi:hypothetical protein